MTYSVNEGSRHSGQPVEPYLFTLGRDASVGAGEILAASDGLEYASIVAAEAAGWVFTDTHSAGAWDEPDTVTVYQGSRAFKATFTGSGGSGLLRTERVFGAADGIEADTMYRLRGAMRASNRPWYDVDTSMYLIGTTSAENAYDADEGTWEFGSTGLVNSGPGATLTIRLERQSGWGHGSSIWFDRMEIWKNAAPELIEQTEYHYTSADVSVVFGGDTYAPAIFTRSAFSGGESEGGDVELTIPRNHEIALLFRDGLPIAPVTCTIYRIHRPDVAAGTSYATPFKGRVSRARWRGPSCTLTLTNGNSLLSRKLPRVLIQPQCNWMLYDGRCQLLKEAHRFDSTITAVDGVTLTISGLDADGGAYAAGYLEVPSGEVAFIESQDGDVVTLLNPPQSIAVSDAVAVYEGCDRTPARCQALGNLTHFGGDALLPQKNLFGPTGFNV